MFLAIVLFIFRIFKFIKLAIGFVLATVNIINLIFNNKIPENICNPEVMTQYLKAGGDPNASRYLGSGFYTIANCFNLMDDNPDLLELYIAKGGQ